jgi:LPXTG-motif cell wall-anchored protein
MSILSWVIFGALAGWVASIITGRNSRMGCLANIIIGVIGAAIGGFIMNFFSEDGFSMDWDLTSFLVAVGGAVLLLIITGWFNRRRRKTS